MLPATPAIVCRACERKVGLLAPDAVTSMLPAVYDLTGPHPPTRFLLGHPQRIARNADHRCRFRKEVNRAWVDRARRLAESTGRVRLYADEVDRA